LTAKIATGGTLIAFLPRNDSFWAEREGAQPLPYANGLQGEAILHIDRRNPNTIKSF